MEQTTRENKLVWEGTYEHELYTSVENLNKKIIEMTQKINEMVGQVDCIIEKVPKKSQQKKSQPKKKTDAPVRGIDGKIIKVAPIIREVYNDILKFNKLEYSNAEISRVIKKNYPEKDHLTPAKIKTILSKEEGNLIIIEPVHQTQVEFVPEVIPEVIETQTQTQTQLEFVPEFVSQEIIIPDIYGGMIEDNIPMDNEEITNNQIAYGVNKNLLIEEVNIDVPYDTVMPQNTEVPFEQGAIMSVDDISNEVIREVVIENRRKVLGINEILIDNEVVVNLCVFDENNMIEPDETLIRANLPPTDGGEIAVYTARGITPQELYQPILERLNVDFMQNIEFIAQDYITAAFSGLDQEEQDKIMAEVQQKIVANIAPEYEIGQMRFTISFGDLQLMLNLLYDAVTMDNYSVLDMIDMEGLAKLNFLMYLQKASMIKSDDGQIITEHDYIAQFGIQGPEISQMGFIAAFGPATDYEEYDNKDERGWLTDEDTFNIGPSMLTSELFAHIKQEYDDNESVYTICNVISGHIRDERNRKYDRAIQTLANKLEKEGADLGSWGSYFELAEVRYEADNIFTSLDPALTDRLDQELFDEVIQAALCADGYGLPDVDITERRIVRFIENTRIDQDMGWFAIRDKIDNSVFGDRAYELVRNDLKRIARVFNRAIVCLLMNNDFMQAHAGLFIYLHKVFFGMYGEPLVTIMVQQEAAVLSESQLNRIVYRDQKSGYYCVLEALVREFINKMADARETIQCDLMDIENVDLEEYIAQTQELIDMGVVQFKKKLIGFNYIKKIGSIVSMYKQKFCGGECKTISDIRRDGLQHCLKQIELNQGCTVETIDELTKVIGANVGLYNKYGVLLDEFIYDETNKLKAKIFTADIQHVEACCIKNEAIVINIGHSCSCKNAQKLDNQSSCIPCSKFMKYAGFDMDGRGYINQIGVKCSFDTTKSDFGSSSRITKLENDKWIVKHLNFTGCIYVDDSEVRNFYVNNGFQVPESEDCTDKFTAVFVRRNDLLDEIEDLKEDVIYVDSLKFDSLVCDRSLDEQKKFLLHCRATIEKMFGDSTISTDQPNFDLCYKAFAMTNTIDGELDSAAFDEFYHRLDGNITSMELDQVGAYNRLIECEFYEGLPGVYTEFSRTNDIHDQGIYCGTIYCVAETHPIYKLKLFGIEDMGAGIENGRIVTLTNPEIRFLRTVGYEFIPVWGTWSTKRKVRAFDISGEEDAYLCEMRRSWNSVSEEYNSGKNFDEKFDGMRAYCIISGMLNQVRVRTKTYINCTEGEYNQIKAFRQDMPAFRNVRNRDVFSSIYEINLSELFKKSAQDITCNREKYVYDLEEDEIKHLEENKYRIYINSKEKRRNAYSHIGAFVLAYNRINLCQKFLELYNSGLSDRIVKVTKDSFLMIEDEDINGETLMELYPELSAGKWRIKSVGNKVVRDVTKYNLCNYNVSKLPTVDFLSRDSPFLNREEIICNGPGGSGKTHSLLQKPDNFGRNAGSLWAYMPYSIYIVDAHLMCTEARRKYGATCLVASAANIFTYAGDMRKKVTHLIFDEFTKYFSKIPEIVSYYPNAKVIYCGHIDMQTGFSVQSPDFSICRKNDLCLIPGAFSLAVEEVLIKTRQDCVNTITEYNTLIEPHLANREELRLEYESCLNFEGTRKDRISRAYNFAESKINTVYGNEVENYLYSYKSLGKNKRAQYGIEERSVRIQDAPPNIRTADKDIKKRWKMEMLKLTRDEAAHVALGEIRSLFTEAIIKVSTAMSRLRDERVLAAHVKGRLFKQISKQKSATIDGKDVSLSTSNFSVTAMLADKDGSLDRIHVINYEIDYRVQCDELRRLKKELEAMVTDDSKTLMQCIAHINTYSVHKITMSQLRNEYTPQRDLLLSGTWRCNFVHEGKRCIASNKDGGVPEECRTHIAKAGFMARLYNQLSHRGQIYVCTRNSELFQNGSIEYVEPRTQHEKCVALSIFCTQGQTLYNDRVIIFTKSVFSKELLYVAISRCVRLDQIYFCNDQPEAKITAAKKEMSVVQRAITDAGLKTQNVIENIKPLQMPGQLGIIDNMSSPFSPNKLEGSKLMSNILDYESLMWRAVDKRFLGIPDVNKFGKWLEAQPINPAVKFNEMIVKSNPSQHINPLHRFRADVDFSQKQAGILGIHSKDEFFKYIVTAWNLAIRDVRGLSEMFGDMGLRYTGNQELDELVEERLWLARGYHIIKNDDTEHRSCECNLIYGVMHPVHRGRKNKKYIIVKLNEIEQPYEDDIEALESYADMLVYTAEREKVLRTYNLNGDIIINPENAFEDLQFVTDSGVNIYPSTRDVFEEESIDDILEVYGSIDEFDRNNHFFDMSREVPDGYKYSAHIISKYMGIPMLSKYVQNVFIYYADKLVENLSMSIDRIVKDGNGNLRMPYSQKAGMKKTPKIPAEFSEMLVVATINQDLVKLDKEQEKYILLGNECKLNARKKNATACGKLANSNDKLLNYLNESGLLTGYIWSEDGKLMPTSNSHCSLCDRQHQSDMYGVMTFGDDKFKTYNLHCFRANRSFKVFEKDGNFSYRI